MSSSHDKTEPLRLDAAELEALVMEYIDAVEDADFARIGDILALAEQAPALLPMLQEVNDALYAEMAPYSTTRPTLTPSTAELEALVAEAAPSLASPDASAEQQPQTPAPTMLADATTETASQLPSEVDQAHRIDEPSHADTEASSSRSNASRRRAWALGGASLSVLGALALVWLLPLSAPRKPGPIDAAVAQCSQTRTPEATPQAHKTPTNWIQAVHHEPQQMVRMLASGPMHQDLLALRENQHLPTAVSRRLAPERLSASHRAMRARLYLRIARFHLKNYKMALSFHREVYQRRLARAKSLHLGQKFHFYWGRLLCLRGEHKRASTALQKALTTAPQQMRSRVQMWHDACTPEASRRQIAQRLAQQRFPKGSDSWADWYLLHQLKGLVPQTHPKGSLRASLYAAVLQQKAPRWPSFLLRTPVESEQIQERGIQAQLDYYDPAVFMMMGRDYAGRALRLLKRARKDDKYAPFYIAESHRLLGQRRAGLSALLAFLKRPPTAIDGAYLFFSHRLSPRFLRQEACYELSQSPAVTQGQSKRILAHLGRGDRSGRALAGLGMIQQKINPQVGFRWLKDGIEQAQLELNQVRQRYLVASVQAPKPDHRQGAQIIAQLELYRYQYRALYLWGSIGALQLNHGSQATRWLERLHRKETPYKISGENEPLQFAWTARAYLGAGKPGIASLFLSKNLDAYPSLTQLWDLLRVWRIYEGMDSVPKIKG